MNMARMPFRLTTRSSRMTIRPIPARAISGDSRRTSSAVTAPQLPTPQQPGHLVDSEVKEVGDESRVESHDDYGDSQDA